LPFQSFDGGMKRFATIAGMLFVTSTTQLAAVPAAVADCSCRYKGGEIFEGQTTCIRTSSGSTLARCEKFLNNTSWKMLNQPCPTASLGTPAGSSADPAILSAVRG